MEIEIKGKTYKLEVNGTIGLIYFAERFLNETFDSANHYHECALYYAAIATSNDDYPTMQDFMTSLTQKTLIAIRTYVNERWTTLEGEDIVQDNKDGKKKD